MIGDLVSPQILMSPMQWGLQAGLACGPRVEGAGLNNPNLQISQPTWLATGQIIFNAKPAEAAALLNGMSALDAGKLFYWAKPELIAERAILMDHEKAAQALNQVSNPHNDPDRSNFWLRVDSQFDGILREMHSRTPAAVNIFVRMEPKNVVRGLNFVCDNRRAAAALESLPSDKTAKIVNLLSLQSAAGILDYFSPKTTAAILAAIESKNAGKILNLLGWDQGCKVIGPLDNFVNSAQRMGQVFTSMDSTEKAVQFLKVLSQARSYTYFNNILDWMVIINRGRAVNIISKFKNH